MARNILLRRDFIWLVAGLAVAVAACFAAYHLAYARQIAEIERQVQDRLTLNQRAVEIEIERFRYLPGVLGQDERIIDMLASPETPGAIAEVNDYLYAVREMSGADEIYVINPLGLTLAASNWNEPGSYVGHNYGFRPYFTNAVTGEEGRFYAVGVTTGKPGYFLAKRVMQNGVLLGVVVAKVNLEPLARIWAEAGETTGIADSDGVVFLAGDPAWRYRPLQALDQATLLRLNFERRYDGIDVANAPPMVPSRNSLEDRLIVPLGDDKHLLGRRWMEPDGWHLLTALPLGPAEREAQLVSGVVALLALLALAGLAFAGQRQQLTRIKLEQNALLEQRVAERTSELAIEVEERKRTEAELRATQENLIHAAKLAALGRMSAAIVHEVSQPLSALDSSLAAADLHVGRDAKPEARRTLANARRLLLRMQRTVKHLRSFSSRRTPGPPEAVAIAQVVQEALEIVEPQARDAGVSIAAELGEALPDVAGNATRLEQVFINLLLNGIEATAQAGNSQMSVSAKLLPDAVEVAIADSGAGMPDDVKQRLFEPFFSTKQSGESLGLGLSITKTLLEEFGGALEFSQNQSGGTIASVRLPLFAQAKVESAEEMA